jgi:hypothetical protein
MRATMRSIRALGCLPALGIFWALAAGTAAQESNGGETFRRLPVKEYRDKMKAGWIGQIAGVSWGAPTEFRYRDQIMPEGAMPRWTPGMINHAFGQDDLYVEMTFLRSMEQYGLDVPIRQAGIDFANSGYALWCANNAGRTNLRRGIAPPDSSHPKFNRCPNDIDYQIEADFSGLIAPGMPNVAIKLGEKFGRLMNYGDGMYAGQMIGGMYAEAFFTEDVEKIVEAGLRCIPAKSQHAEMARDMLRWFKEDPDDWQRTWNKCQEKYRKNPEYQKASNGGIDCKINGAYVLMGLLYGRRDLDKTIVISCRSGMDSDCNPSSSAGVLFTTIGFSKLSPRFSKELDEKAVFSHTAYHFPALIAVCEKLARQALVRQGGRVEKDASGEEVFVIPVVDPKPSPLELSWAPGPIAGSTFTPEEMAQIKVGVFPDFDKFAPGWKIKDCGPDMDPGLREQWGGKKKVFVTHPLDRNTGCTIWREAEVPAGKKTVLRLVVGHDPKGDWTLIVKADGKQVYGQPVDKATAAGGWMEVVVDLSPYAGKKVKLELVNQADGWAFEAAYWAKIELESR